MGYGHGARIVPTLRASVAQTNTEEPLLFDGRIKCPWCKVWEPEEAFTELQTPPDFPEQCGVVLKHGGESGCKGLFSIRALRRPARSLA